LAGLHLLLCAWAFADDRFLNDEGLLTQLFAELVGRDPWPAIFLQKVRPPISLLYAPVAADLTWFLWAHAVVGAAGVVAIAAAARNFGHTAPNVAAAVVALSPMFVAGSAAGLSNADAVTGLCLVAWAGSARRWALAGAGLGALVWVRSELVVIVIALSVAAALLRRPRFFAGLLAWPVLYGLAGSVYHHDLLWMLHFPPALPEPMPDNPFWRAQPAAPSVAELALAAAAISPLWPLALTIRARDLDPFERALAFGTIALVLALALLPRWRVFNFDQSPRYLMPAVVAVALAVARGAGRRWTAPGWHATFALAAVAGGVVAGLRLDGDVRPTLALAGCAGCIALGRAGREGLARVVAMGMCAVGPATLTSGARIDRATQAGHVDEMVARLQEHAASLPARPVYTNEPILAAYLARSGGLPQARVRYLVQADQLYELTVLSNPDNGQRAAIRAALQAGFYGDPVFPEALDPDRVDPAGLFVVTGDDRLRLVMPRRVWESRLRVLHPGQRAQVLEVVPAPRRRRGS
jgi:hypothetical protein